MMDRAPNLASAALRGRAYREIALEIRRLGTVPDASRSDMLVRYFGKSP